MQLMLSHEIFQGLHYKVRLGIRYLQWYFLALTKIQNELLRFGVPVTYIV